MLSVKFFSLKYSQPGPFRGVRVSLKNCTASEAVKALFPQFSVIPVLVLQMKGEGGVYPEKDWLLSKFGH